MAEPKRTTHVFVRQVDDELWHQLTVEARKRRTTLGPLLNEILREWLERQQQKGAK